jgi:hypothetical protein
LDQQHDAKQISDQGYVNGRLELFKKYMPEALPADSSPRDSDRSVGQHLSTGQITSGPNSSRAFSPTTKSGI